jgi:hypothetical protein
MEGDYLKGPKNFCNKKATKKFEYHCLHEALFLQLKNMHFVRLSL